MRRARELNKLSALKKKPHIPELGCYQAYADHAKIVPYVEKLRRLDAADRNQKLSFLINDMSGALQEDENTFNS